MRELLSKNIQGKKVLILFIVTNLVYAFMLLVTVPEVMAYAGEMKLLDIMPAGYDFEYVNALFAALGKEGRDAYLFHQIPVDLVYPLLYAMSFSLIMAYFLKKLNKLKSPFFYLCYLPVIAGISDYGENIGIITMLRNYPDLSEVSVKITSIFSVVKSSSTTIYFVALIIALVILGIKSIFKNKAENISK